MREDNQTTLTKSDAQGRGGEKLLWLIKNSSRILVLAIIYGAMNILSFVALLYIGAGEFTICAQLKILTTASFSVFILHTTISSTKWRALALLVMGCLLVASPSYKNSQNTNKMVAEDILDMFDEYKYICMWEIDANFPTSVLVDNFRSYLYLYYLLNYNGLEPCMMDQYETILEVGLKKCYDHNPSFGRKLVSQENIIVFEWEKKICCKNKKLCSSATTSGDLFNTDAIPLSSWNY
jgi:hypothetical protein